VRLIAEDSQGILRDPAFIVKAVAAFDTWSRTAGKEAADFLYALGPGVVPGLMDIFANDESLGGRKVLFDLLCRFGKASVEEAQKRLGDPRSAYVRNLVMIIRREGTPGSIPSLKPLLQHQDRKVRMEALGALLRFKDLGAIAVLREALRSQDPDVSSQAVFLAGQNRVAAVVDDLLTLIKKVILFDTDYQVNEEIVRALGEIGDPRAIPELEKLARMHLTLYPNSLARMKVTLFESLERYPRESIAGLLKAGLRSSDEKVLRACRKLAERK
jgi:HEAT repeat protein